MKCGQAMENLNIRITGFFDHRHINLVRFKKTYPFFPYRIRFSHRNPYIGIKVIGTFHCIIDILGDSYSCTCFLCYRPAFCNEVIRRLTGFRRSNPEINAHFGRTNHQRITHVEPGISEITEYHFAERSGRMFGHCQQISEDLGRVKFICKSIPDRDTGIFCQFLNN